VAKSCVTVVSQCILKPSKKKQKTTTTKVSRHIYLAPSYWGGGGGVIERVIEVDTYRRLGLFFAARGENK